VIAILLKIKNLMKKLLPVVFSLTLLISLNAMAQPEGMGKNDADAKKILDAVSAKFKSYKTVAAKFNLKIENASGKVEGSKAGTVNMKGVKYRVSVTGQEIFFDGSNIWTYDKSSNEVEITKFDASANTITPQKLFTNFYDKDFLYKLNGETKSGGKTLQEIELTPIDKSKTFFKVLLNIDKSSQTIVSTKVFEKNGNKYTYTVSNMKPNSPISDDVFVFNEKNYPKVEVVDLR